MEREWAEIRVLSLLQHQCFASEISALQKLSGSDQSLPKSSSIRALDPIWDGEMRLLRVGGRIGKAHMSYDAKCPIILPSKHEAVALLIHHRHCLEGHGPSVHVLNILHQNFLILKGHAAVKWEI